MRGSPLREVLLVIMGAVILWFPLKSLTGKPSVLEESELETGENLTADCWLDFRFSHPPLSVQILQGDQVLWKGDATLRQDADVLLQIKDAHLSFQIQLEWPEAVEQGYAEITLEADNLPAETFGFWGSGVHPERLEMEWINPM